MNKLKLIWGYGPVDFERKVDEWSENENPNVISSSISMSDNYCAISIVYEENSEKEIHNLLKS